MVMYHIGHYGGLSRCVTHKLLFHNDEEAVFLIDIKLCSPAIKEYISLQSNQFKEQNIANLILYSEDDFVNIVDEVELEKKVITEFDELLDGKRLKNEKVMYF